MREGLTKLNEQGGTQQLHSVNAASRNGWRGEGGGQLPASHDNLPVDAFKIRKV
jgi:hypothetical protein